MICYLAGPIDYEADQGKGWRGDLKKLCEGNRDIAFFDPYAPYKFGNITDKVASYIHDVNMMAMERADCVVGRMMKGQTSVGTPIEFYQSLRRKPVIIWTDMGESVYMKYIGVHAILVKDINELYGTILKTSTRMEEREAQFRVGPADSMHKVDNALGIGIGQALTKDRIG